MRRTPESAGRIGTRRRRCGSGRKAGADL